MTLLNLKQCFLIVPLMIILNENKQAGLTENRINIWLSLTKNELGIDR